MAENDIDYFIEKVRHSAMKISTFDVVRENAVRETRRPDGWSHGSFSQVRHEDNLTKLQRGQYTGPVTSQMCKDLASRIDSTGLNVDLSKASAYIKLSRRDSATVESLPPRHRRTGLSSPSRARANTPSRSRSTSR